MTEQEAKDELNRRLVGFQNDVKAACNNWDMQLNNMSYQPASWPLIPLDQVQTADDKWEQLATIAVEGSEASIDEVIDAMNHNANLKKGSLQ